MALFADRRDAGRVLAKVLTAYASRADVVVLGLPRGGVPVAYEVARELGAPLDVFVVRKLGVPGHEELAMGAIASGGVRVLNPQVLDLVPVRKEVLEEVARRELRELHRREELYRAGLPPLEVAGRTALLVDDGLATGATMRAGVLALRQLGPAAVVVAVPIAAPETCAELREQAEDVVCAVTPQPFRAIGLWYRDFSQTTDEEVRELLQAGRSGAGSPGGSATGGSGPQVRAL